jgi:hypothetical protein
VRAELKAEPAEAFRHECVTTPSRPHAHKFPKTPEYWHSRQPKAAEITVDTAGRPIQYQRLLD